MYTSDYEMKVIGPYNNIKEFINIMSAKYVCKNITMNGLPVENSYNADGPHMLGIQAASCNNISYEGNGIGTAFISGYCLCSLSACILPNELYNDTRRKRFAMATDALTESKRLGLIIEAYALDNNLDFQEYFVIDNGEIKSSLYSEDTGDIWVYESYDYIPKQLPIVEFEEIGNCVRFAKPYVVK